MIRVGMIFFGADGKVYSVCSLDAPSAAPDDVAAAVRSQWDSNCASCFAFWGSLQGLSANYPAKP